MSGMRTEIYTLQPEDVQRLVKKAVEEATGELQESIGTFISSVSRKRVVTHKEAPQLFDSEVTPETILEYIKFWGLPAVKKGRKYYLYTDDILSWQIGEIGFKEKAKSVTVIKPTRK